MSRARRGGSGARGGRGPAGTHRIAGVDIPVDSELQVNDRPQPTELFPVSPHSQILASQHEAQITKPKPLSKDERLQVARFRSLRDRIHAGPLYTVLGDNVRVGKPGNTAAAHFDPFEGMQTYSQRYTAKRRRIPKLDTRPYVLKFFPNELWPTLDPIQNNPNGVSSNPKVKKLQIAPPIKRNSLTAFDREVSGEPDKNLLERLTNGDEDDETGEPQIVEEDELEEIEDADDDYDSDESDMAGDYNGEQYFDGGGEDGGDDYDAGEADGNEF
ncbi:hypothetical protein MMC06_005330 [Schaereria dolodes]|nr:hypothetical protein [Schaereria dolodes]